MSASVVERLVVGPGSTVTSLDVDFTATVQSGDVVLIFASGSTSAYTTTWAVSGLGTGSWPSTRYDSDSTVEVFSTTATSDGVATITVTGGTSWRGTHAAVLIRGTSGTVSPSSTNIDSGSSINGPSSSAGDGQVVATFGAIMGSQATFDRFETYDPSTGWTTENAASSIFVSIGLATRVPTSTADHQVTDSTASGTRDYRIVQVVVGDAAGAGTTGTVSGTAPSPVGAIEGAVITPVTGAVTGTSPSPVGALEGDVTVPDGSGTVEGVAPSPVGAIWGNSGYPATATLIRRNMPFGRTATPALLPAPVPPKVTERALTVLAHPMPALTPSNKRNRPGVDYQLLHGDPVRAHIFVDGVDVTFLRDHPAVIGDWSSSDPLTDTAAAFTMPQIAEGDVLGADDLSMFDLDRDPTVDIALIRESDGALLHVWDGHIAREDDSSGEGTGRSFICEGSIMAAAHSTHMPPTIMDETDIGIVIPRVLNGTPGRRFHTIAETVTGITTSKRGNQAMSRLQYVEELLATAYTESGHQVTLTKIGPRQHALVVKDGTAWTARVVKGAHGVNARLARDQSMRWDAIYGEGVAPNGGGWGNWFFPGLDLFIPPPYPYNPGSNQTISVGDTDAGTVTGDGVTVATTRLADLGYAVTPGSTFTSAHAAATSQLQRANGLLVDGIVGPQTWTSMFTPGLDEIDLQAVRLPLASKPWVLPNEYAANGATIGPNPNHDPVPIPKAPNIKFGADITKAHATELARRMLITNGEPAWTGSLTLTSDPIDPDGVPFSRLMLREGDMVLVEGHDGGTVMRVADASRDGVAVTLRVDEKNRDALTLDAIRLRNMEARQDTVPPGSPQKISSLTRDHIVQFEEESKAGQIPTYPVNGNVGLWSVFPIVVSQTGRIAKLDAMARNATTTFVMAFFGREIQPQRLAALVPNPIASSDGWREHEETLILDHAWIETFGGPGSLAGYSPWQQSDGRAVTGDLRDYSGLEFTSERRGYLWVAVFSSASCNISGRAYPAIPQ